MKRAVLLLIVSMILITGLYGGDDVKEKVSVQWWLVPLVATDSNGNPVADLEKEHIELYVDGKRTTEFIFYRKELRGREIGPGEKGAEFLKPDKKVIYIVIDNLMCSPRELRRAKYIACMTIVESDPSLYFVLMSIEPFIGLKYHAGPTNDKELLLRGLKDKIILKARKGYYRKKLFATSMQTLNHSLKVFKDKSKIIYLVSPGMCCGAGSLYFMKDSADTLRNSGSLLFAVNPTRPSDSDIFCGNSNFLKYLVKETGGRYYEGKKEAIVEDMIRVNRSYYEIAFPEWEGKTGNTSKIVVKTTRPGVDVSSVREVSHGKDYGEMNRMEREFLVLNALSGGYWARTRLKILEAASEKHIIKKDMTGWTFQVPENFVRKEIHFYSIKIDSKKNDTRITRKTVTPAGSEVKISFEKDRRNKGYQKYIVAVDKFSNTAVIYK